MANVQYSDAQKLEKATEFNKRRESGMVIKAAAEGLGPSVASLQKWAQDLVSHQPDASGIGGGAIGGDSEVLETETELADVPPVDEPAAEEGWGSQSITAEIELGKRPRGYRYPRDEKRTILRRVQELQALGQPLNKALAAVGVTYATFNRWLEDAELRPPQSRPNPPREPVMTRVPLSSGVELGPYALVLDARDLVAANKAAIVAALTIGKHEDVKAAILGLLDV